MSNTNQPAPQAPPAPKSQEDQAVEFLTALQPKARAERTRAFAALLRAITSEGNR